MDTPTALRIRAHWNGAGAGNTGQIQGAQRGPLTHKFCGHWGTPDAQMRWDLPTVRARSREMAGSPVLTAFANAVLNNVLGPNGMHFQSKVKTSKLFGDATDDVSDKKACDMIESGYVEICSVENYLVSRDMTKREADELKLRTLIFDGEVFVRTHQNFDNSTGIARQIIDPDLCDIDYNEPNLPDGGQIRMSKRYDKWGAVVSYFFLKRHPFDYQANPSITREREEVPAKEVRHIYFKLRPGQSRGLPLTAPALLSVRQLEAFVDAAVVNARIGAARNVYYEKKFPTGWLASDGVKVSGDQGAIIEDLREGESLELPWGVEAKTLDTRFPNGEIDPFTKVAMRFNSMGLGTSYMTLSNDLSEANFSSLRAGLNEERSLWARWQQFFIEADCDPDFKESLRWSLATQLIKLPLARIKKFLQYQFTGRRWSSVNPLQDAMADDAEVAAGRKSPQECIRERGRDWEEVLQEIADFRNRAAELKITFGDAAAAATGDQGKESDSEIAKRELDAYGVGVRAGTITPSKPDEEFFRKSLELPPMSKEAVAAWDEDGGVRRPITLTPAPSDEPAPAVAAPAQPPAKEARAAARSAAIAEAMAGA